jgi:hypothetical protein
MLYMPQIGVVDMNTQTNEIADLSMTLSKAFLNAGKALGLSQDELGQIVGRDRTTFRRGLDPESKPGELALLLIRIYRGLYALVGGHDEGMKHWMHTLNRHTGGIPSEQVKTVAGLVHIVEYLDAMRGKV